VLVWHVHEIVIRPRLTAWLFRLVPGLTSDRVIAVSAAVRRHVTPLGLFRSRTLVVRNGLPARQPPGRPRDARQALRIAYVGRLNRWKGYELFVEAAAALAVDHPDLRFVIAGDPPPGEAWRRDDLLERIAAARIGDRVDVLGFVEDGSAILEGVDIAVVPSTWPDPLPTVVGRCVPGAPSSPPPPTAGRPR
jgi:glycosyltransferase involved in cell wall biosynthesis